MKASRLTQSDDPAYPLPTSDLDVAIDQFLNRWQWRCPTVDAREDLLELLAYEEPPACPLLIVE